MISCPHSIYFFRGKDEDFRYFFIDDYKGEKNGDELNTIPSPLLVRANEGDYYRAANNFHVESYNGVRNFVVPSGTLIKAGTYLMVSNVGTSQSPSYKFEIFDGKVANTLIDWGMVPLNLPVIAPPNQKLHTIDVPGADGLLDLSNSLTKVPVFDNRTGSLKFAVHPAVTSTNNAYEKILNFLQGVDVKMILEDDPEFFYRGRVFVESIDPKNDGTYSEVSLGYSLYPYKESIYSSIDDWLWDPFNFETDSIQETIFLNININMGPYDVEHRSYTHPVDPTNVVELDFTGSVGQKPVKPEFIFDSYDPYDSQYDLHMKLMNTDLYGNSWHTSANNYEVKDNFSGDTFYNEDHRLAPNIDRARSKGNTFRDLIFCEYTPDSKVKMQFTGRGFVTIKFRSGRL